MTTISAVAQQHGRTVPRQPDRVRALSVRRWFLVAAPVLAGLFAVIGAAADPAVGLEGPELFRLYAANPEPLQIKSLALHWSYAFWFVPGLLIAPYVRGRGAWLANLTAAVAFVGMTTLPGLLFSDWYESAIGQLYGVEGNLAVSALVEKMWAVPFFTTPGVVGLFLVLPMTALTLWRAGLARWWSLAAALAALGAFLGSGITWWGCAVATVFMAVVSFALFRATQPQR